ncbi:MAG TPA: DNA methyltransferase [Terriglobia bacterium]|nr:DNA methyltransferase [Terriglobia bacterium]
MNTLYYGDNLDILRRYIKDETVDLVYLDPPFKSNQDYNVLFAEKDGTRAAAQIKAFEDTWQWDQEAARAYHEIVETGPERVSKVMQAFMTFLGGSGDTASDMMAYLAMMSPRLVELHRVLKLTGGIYLHCDSTASHYLKLLMDSIFRPENFRNEIIWKRTHAHSDSKQGARHYGRVTDTLLFYSKGPEPKWNPQYVPYGQEYLDRDYRRTDSDGRRYRIDNLQGPGGAAKGNPQYEVMGVTRYWRYSKEHMDELIRQGRVIQTRPGAVPQYKRYLDEMPGVPTQNLWDDLPPINNRSKELLGYPTQKPEALLERIIKTGTDEGNLVLDPFCGCGTAIAVAERLKRNWIGIDITHLAIGLVRRRLLDAFGDAVQFEIKGEPISLPDAEKLAREEPYQFQSWALGLIGARHAELKKGADKGIDGHLYFHDEPKTTKQVVISVKGGHLLAQHVRDLRGVIEREKAAIGVLITMQEPTHPMRAEAASAGFYEAPWGRKYARLQLLTVAELLAGKTLDFPRENVTFKKAPKAKAETPADETLPF